jgi:hypothetical protein
MEQFEEPWFLAPDCGLITTVTPSLAVSCSQGNLDRGTLMRKLGLVLILLVCGLSISQLGLFIVPPIGAVPEGRTLVVIRSGNMKFIDSADGICQRVQDGVSLLCRGVALASVLKNSVILLRLPYSETLDKFTTK